MSSNLNKVTVLLTTAEEDSAAVKKMLEEEGAQIRHYPLERYRGLDNEEEVLESLRDMTEYENVVYGHRRNAVFFLDFVERHNLKEAVKERLNFAVDNETAHFLEANGIPAVKPAEDAKAIKLIEFMLRIRRLGTTLYPCGTEQKEEVPGLLQELEIEVDEIPLFELTGPEDEELEDFRIDVMADEPEVLIMHSRHAVNRVPAAFPELNLDDKVVVSASPGVTRHLQKKEIQVNVEADGNWVDVIDALSEYLEKAQHP